MTTWGLVATVKAPPADVLRFVAHHLNAGASQLYIYLDDTNEAAEEALRHYPQCIVTRCDAPNWIERRGRRPDKHQVRQSLNAGHAYRRATALDWLIHIDVDEFIVSDRSVSELLTDLPAEISTARLRPSEPLCHHQDMSPSAYKSFVPAGPERHAIVRSLYPTFGKYIKGGFLSHVAGKLFTRTGLTDLQIKIHNTLRNGKPVSEEAALDEAWLAHLHTTSREHWLKSLDYRLARGSYRKELKPAVPFSKGGRTLHDLLTDLMLQEENDGLRAFFDEVCADTPILRSRLQAHGLLRLHDLCLENTKNLYFPDFNS